MDEQYLSPNQMSEGYEPEPVQNFAIGGIALPGQRAFLRGSDKDYLAQRAKELEAFEAQRQAYNNALTKYQEEVYKPYSSQYDAYAKAVETWNAGPRTEDYAGPAEPTLASFDMKAPELPFKEEDVKAYQQAAGQRAQKDAASRAVAIDVVSNPDKFNFGSMSVAGRFMAEGGPVERDDNEALDGILQELSTNSQPSPFAPLQAIQQDPNLSPTMLGGQANMGFITDRLGNRIYAPAAPMLFAEGGEASEEDYINTDPLGSAQKMMADLMGSKKASPNEVSVKRVAKSSGGAKSGKEMTMGIESLMSAKAQVPELKGEDSARSQMEALALAYKLKAQEASNAARGLMRNTMGAPTLEKPALTKNSLAKKRFEKGGEVKKSEGDGAEMPQSPEEQPVAEESSASRALKSFVSRLKEGAQGYLGLDPGVSGSDAYRTGQALGNMPGVGAPAAVAGIFIGKGAKGWNAASNALAKKITSQGASPEEVWKTTGNFKAPDGQWRQEISDAGAQMRESILQGPASRVLSHPELFENYPELGKIMTRKDPYSTRSVLMGGTGPDPVIQVGTAGGKNESAKGMLHEMQHAIQFKEGFGQGGSKTMAFTDPKAFEILKEVRSRMAQPASIEDFAKVAWQSNEVTPEIAKKYQQYLDYHKKSLKNMDKAAQEGAAELYYKRLLGEAEARAVEGRKPLTMEQRLQLIPSQSYRTNAGRDIIPLDQLIVKRAEGSPKEGELSQEELDAASRPAFVTPRSGIGRKQGPISRALNTGEAYVNMAKGATELPYDIAGAPVDIATMALRPFGYGVDKPVMGSDWIKEKMTAAKVRPEPPKDATDKGFYTAGQLLSNLTNPAGVTRSGVRAVQKAGEAASDVAKDFQQYNRQLAVPSASYVSRAPGGYFPTSRANEGGVLSSLDNALNPILKQVKEIDDPAKREALSMLFNQKAKDFFTKQAGSVQDPLRADILSGALRFDDESSMGDVFPRVLQKNVAQGDLQALRLLEKNYDQMIGIKTVVPRRTDAPQVDNVPESQILANMRDNIDKIPDAQLLAYAGKKPAPGPTGVADAAAEVRKKLQANPTLFSTVLEPRIARTLFPETQYSTDTDMARYPTLYGTTAVEAMVVNPALQPQDYTQKVSPGYFLPDLDKAIEKGQPILDISKDRIKLLGMDGSKLLSQALQMPVEEINRMGFADFIKKAYANTQQIDKFEAALPKVKKMIQAGKPPPADIMTYGVKDFVPSGDVYRWVKVVKPDGVRAIAAGMNNSVGSYATSSTYGSLGKGRAALDKGEAEIYSLYDRDNVPHVTVEYLTAKPGVPDNKKNTIAQLTGNGPLTGNDAPENYAPHIVDLLNNLRPSSVPLRIKSLLESTGQKASLSEEVMAPLYFGVPLEALRARDDNLLRQLGAP